MRGRGFGIGDLMQLAREAAFPLGALEVRPPTREVVFPGGREVLQPRVMQVLVALGRDPGAVVSRDELIARCWEGRVVGEDAITLVIMKLRKLAARAGEPFAIQTIPRVGYRLAATNATPARPAAPGGSGRARPRITVLPFAHPPGETDLARFAEALVDELTAGLSKSPLLTVTPRPALARSDAADPPPGEIGARPGLDYVLDGRVLSLGGTVRVSVNLIQGADQTSAWSARHDHPVADLFPMLTPIAAAIICALEPALLEREASQIERTPDYGAPFWRLFVRGRRHFWRSTPEDVRMAETLLQQALEIEPDDVSALSTLAHCRLFDVWVGRARDPAAAVDEASRIALRAVAAGGSDAFAHYTLGVVLSMMDRLPEAMAEQRRALELNPYLAAAWGEMGRLLAFEGRSGEAITCSERAIAASPDDPHGWLWFRSKALARFCAGDYELAARDAADACARGAGRFPLHFLLAACFSAAGHPAQARRALEDGERLARGRHSGPRPTSYPMAALKTGHPFVDAEPLDRLVQALKACGWRGA